MQANEILRFLDDINSETEVQTIRDLIELLENFFADQNRRQIRSTRIDSKFFLQKLLAWYTGCYQQQSTRDSFQQAEFCSGHDTVIFSFARLLITIARKNYPQIIYSVVTFSLEALQLNLSKESAPGFHFMFSMLNRLIADEQILTIISFNIQKLTTYAANTLIIAAVQKINFAITSTTLFLRAALYQYSIGMMNQNYLPLKGTTLCDVSEEGGDRHLNAILNKLPQIKTNKLIKFQCVQNLNMADNADLAINKQFNSLKETIENELYNCQLVYIAATLLRINHRHASIDIMTSLISVCQKSVIRLQRFAILPQCILYFIQQYIFAKDSLQQYIQQNQQQDAKQRKADQKYQQLQKVFTNAQSSLPSVKVIQRIRDYALSISQQFQYLSRRILAFLSQKQASVQFGQALGEMVISLNNSLYVGQLAIDASLDSSYGSELYKYLQPRSLSTHYNNIESTENHLSRNDQNYIKMFCMLFSIPTNENCTFQTPFKSFKLNQEDVLKIQFGESKVTSKNILEKISINSEENKINLRGFDFINQIYGCDVSLFTVLTNALPLTLDGEEQEIYLAQFLELFESQAQLIKKMLINSNIKSGCLLQNMDNYLFSQAWVSLYQVQQKDNSVPIQQYARLISNYLQSFGTTNYNSSLAVHLLIAGIMQRQNMGLKLPDVVDAFYEAAQIIFNPLLCGLTFDYRTTLLINGPGSISGSITQQLGIDYTGLQVGDQNVTSYLCGEFVDLDDKVLVTQYMKQTRNCQLIKYDTKTVLSGIFQSISLVSQMMDSMYADFAHSLKVNDVSQYSYILDLTISSIVKVVMPYFQNLDVSLIENMNDLLLEMVQKLSVKSPLTSCVLIMGLNRSKELMKKVQDQLLGQVIQFSIEEPNNVDYITSFTLCCMQSQYTDSYFVELLVNKVLYISQSFLPYRILTRFLFRDESFRHKNPALIISLFDPSDYEMKVKKFIMANQNLPNADRILYLVAKLISLLFEYDCYNEELQTKVYYLIIEYIFDEQYGLLSYISKYNDVQFDSCFNDLNQDTRMQLLMNLSLVCQNPCEPNAIIRFVNYYLLHLSQKFNIKLSVAIGNFLDSLLIGSVTRCRELFYKFLMINSVTFKNEETFCYCFSQLCMSKSIEFIRYMSQNLSLFNGKINCNLLLQTFELKDYETQIQVCKYMKQKGYYLDSLIVSKILKRNCNSYYDGFVRRNQLLRELYNFDYISFEGLLPTMVVASKLNLVNPIFFQQKLFTFENSSCTLSNIFNQSIYSIPNGIHLLTVNLDQSLGITQCNGVVNGEKEASYFENINVDYLGDIRVIDDPITEAAIDHFQTRKLPKAVRLTSFNDIAQLQIMYGDNVQKFLQKLSVQDAIKYLSLDEQRYQEMQQLLAPRFCSTPIRAAFYKNFAETKFWFSPPISDFIPNQVQNRFISLSYGLESYNIIEPLQLQDVLQKNLVDSQRVTYSLNWADNNNNFSQVSIQFAIQTIVQYLQSNKNSFIFDEHNPEEKENNIDPFIVPLLYILENQALNFIQSAQSDLYRFTELVPITSFECKMQALKALNVIVDTFASQKRKSESRFPVLENIFVQLTNACNSIIQLEDLFVELLTYDRNIVRFYYNPKMKKPYLKKQLQKLNVVKAYANIIITKVNKIGVASVTERIINKQFGYLSNPYYQLLIIQNDNPKQLIGRIEYIENKQELTDFVSFALDQSLNVYCAVGKLLGVGYIADALILDKLLLLSGESLELVLSGFIDCCSIVKVSDQLLGFLEKAFKKLGEKSPILERLKKTLLKLGSAVAQSELQFTDLEGADLFSSLKVLAAKEEVLKETELSYLMGQIADSSLSLIEFATLFAGVQFSEAFVQMFQEYFAAQLLDTKVVLKQLVYVATVAGMQSFEAFLMNSKLFVEEAALAPEFGDFADFAEDEFSPNGFEAPQQDTAIEIKEVQEIVRDQNEEAKKDQIVTEVAQKVDEVAAAEPQVQEAQENGDFGDFGDFADAPMEFVVQPIIKLNYELIIECLGYLLPIFSATPLFSLKLASVSVADLGNEWLDVQIQVISTFSCFWRFDQLTAEQLVQKGFALLEGLGDHQYEALMKLLGQVVNIYGEENENTLKMLPAEQQIHLTRCKTGNFQRSHKEDIGLKINFF